MSKTVRLNQCMLWDQVTIFHDCLLRLFAIPLQVLLYAQIVGPWRVYSWDPS